MQSLDARPGDRLYALSATQERVELKVLGSFRTGNYLIDSGFAFTDLESVKRLSGPAPRGTRCA